jgi:hypothetical protein
MDSKTDFEDDLKQYLDAPPSKAILPLSNSRYDLDDDDGPAPGIRGFEMYSDDSDDSDSRYFPIHMFELCTSDF